jgi:VIT1/CCC1 family predicted Fe2+/Mn2+ transporter
VADEREHGRERNRVAADAAAALGDPEFEDKLRDLSPEEIALFLRAFGEVMRRRRLMLIGTFIALASMIGGFVLALYVYATHEPGTFVGWVFLLPFVLAGASLLLFGRLTRGASMNAPLLPEKRDPD